MTDVPDALHRLLEEENAALRAGALDRVAALAERKEKVAERLAAAAGALSSTDLAGLAELARRNDRLLAAAGAGLRHAMTRLADRRAAAERLDTYGADGRRRSVDIRARRLERWA